jgi:hypothetical protein
MRSYCMLLALVVGLGAVPAALADEPPAGKVDPARIEKLIEDLGSPRFAVRNRARQQLKAIGEPALEALRKAVKSDDAERRRVAAELVKGIEIKLLTAKLLAPKRVKLELDDRPVREAIKELERQSSYPIQVIDPNNMLASRKVTLHTGDTTFWEAFDQLCQKAGLVETNSQFYPPAGPTPFPLPPIRIQPAPAPGVLPPPPAIKPPAGLKGGAVIAPPRLAVQAVGAQVQIQVQAAAVQVQPAQAAPKAFPGRIRGGFGGQLQVQPGTPQKVPTCYAGAIRIRAVPPPPGIHASEGEKQVYLEVTAEPRLQAFVITGAPQLSKVVDDQGQALTVATDTPVAGGVAGQPIGVYYNPYSPGVARRTFVLRFKAGAKQAKALKELTGTLSVQLLAPIEPLLKVDNVLKSVGKEAKGDNGDSMTVASITKQDNGDYKVQVRLTNPPGGIGVGAAWQQMQIVQGGVVRVVAVPMQGNGIATSRSLNLLDAKGRPYQMTMTSSRMQAVGGTLNLEMTLVFRPHPGQGEPASLVLSGQRLRTVAIPFRLENVPLP